MAWLGKESAGPKAWLARESDSRTANRSPGPRVSLWEPERVRGRRAGPRPTGGPAPGKVGTGGFGGALGAPQASPEDRSLEGDDGEPSEGRSSWTLLSSLASS